MPHQCLNCGEIFDDGSPHLLKGCPKCGGKRFFYIKKPLTDEERERRIKELLKEESDKPETIVIEEPGRYRLDIKSLLEDELIIIQKDGSYIIHLPSLFSAIDKEED